MAVILPLILCCRQDCFILLRGIVPAQVLVHPPQLHAPAAPGTANGMAGQGQQAESNQAHNEAQSMLTAGARSAVSTERP
jgi:hypothetical protein